MDNRLRLTAPFALIAALAFAGCSAPAEPSEPAGDSTPAAESPAEETPAEEEAPAEEAADVATLEGYVESAGLTLIDIEAQGGLDALTAATDGMTIEPAECAALIEGSLALAKDNDAALAVGSDAGTGIVGGLTSYADPAVIDQALAQSEAVGSGTCSNLTITLPDGTETTSTTELVDTTVNGADSAYAVRTVTVVQGTETPSVSVTAAVGNIIATGTSIMGDDATAATAVVQKLVDAVTAG